MGRFKKGFIEFIIIVKRKVGNYINHTNIINIKVIITMLYLNSATNKYLNIRILALYYSNCLFLKIIMKETFNCIKIQFNEYI